VLRIIATRGGERGTEILADAPLDRLPALLAEAGTNVWVDLSSPTTPEDVAVVRDVFKFHELAIEDCFETRTHPKVEEYDGYLYVLTHGLRATSSAEHVSAVELDAFVGGRYIVTHHSLASRSVAAVTEGVLKSGLLLRRGPFAVLHALLDRQVEGLESVIDDVEERITRLEDAVFERPANTSIASLLALKRSILKLRRWMSKQREVMLRLGRREFALIPQQEALLFRDVYDHLVRVNDLLENFREMLTSIQEAHLAVTSNRTNEIMKFLTLYTAVLMPLTVISGIYGMNFQHMPELGRWWGYPVTLGLMATVSGSVLLYFRHRGWLGGAAAAMGSTPATAADQDAGDEGPDAGDAGDPNRAAAIDVAGATPTVKTTPSRGHS
jgi:magnesium transporter